MPKTGPSPNVDLVRSIYVGWERGDWTSGDWADPELEFVLADGPDPSSWKGLAAMAEGWFDFLRAWKDYRLEPLEYHEIDSERVFALIEVSGRGRTSGLEMGRTSANLFTIRSGKVTRLVIYWDGESALADLGLRPEA
jgi:ketosteroid isomerase-like protein